MIGFIIFLIMLWISVGFFANQYLTQLIDNHNMNRYGYINPETTTQIVLYTLGGLFTLLLIPFIKILIYFDRD